MFIFNSFNLNIFEKGLEYLCMEIDLKFSTFLKTIKDKEHFNNATLANYLGCSEAAVSLYLTNRSLVGYEKILSLEEHLRKVDFKDIYDYVFNYFEDGFYHGSRQGIVGEIDPELNIDKTLDFGNGFYLGTSFKQSSTFVTKEDGNDKVYKFSFSLEGLDVLELRDIRWVLFVAYNRHKIIESKENEHLIKQIKKVVDHKYDVIIGPIADDRMAISMDNFFNNNITFGQLIRCLTQLNIGDQYCLKTKKACKNLTQEVVYICKDNNLRKLIRDYKIKTSLEASRHAEAIINTKDSGKRYFELLKEYGKKPLF